MKKKFNWVIKSKHVLIIMILVCLSLMALAAAVNLPAGPVKNIVGYAVIPFQKGINSIGTALDSATAGLQNKQKLVEENQQLQDKVDELTAQNSQLTQDLDELDRLQELYNLDQQYSEYDKVAAQVIAMDDENWFSTFTINRGTDDGVQVDCNVITEGGLVGIVTEAGKSWATVRSIIDDSSNVSATVASTSDNCMVTGNLLLMEEGKLNFIQLLDREDKVQPGDRIVTSDISDKFLKGILIGYIDEVEMDSNNLTKTGYLVPVVDFAHIHEVLVIKELKDKGGE